MGKKMAYSSIHIETEVSPGSDTMEFLYGENAFKGLNDITAVVEAEIIESVCSILRKNMGRFSSLPKELEVRYSVYGDEFNLVFYPRRDIQDCQECGLLTYTQMYKHKGKIGELNPGMSYEK